MKDYLLSLATIKDTITTANIYIAFKLEQYAIVVHSKNMDHKF
jgi:hypothetical protein